MRNKLAKGAVAAAMVAASIFAGASPASAAASAAPYCQTLSDLAGTYFQVRCKSWLTVQRYRAWGVCEAYGAYWPVYGPTRVVGPVNTFGAWSSVSCGHLTSKGYDTFVI